MNNEENNETETKPKRKKRHESNEKLPEEDSEESQTGTNQDEALQVSEQPPESGLQETEIVVPSEGTAPPPDIVPTVPDVPLSVTPEKPLKTRRNAIFDIIKWRRLGRRK